MNLPQIYSEIVAACPEADPKSDMINLWLTGIPYRQEIVLAVIESHVTKVMLSKGYALVWNQFIREYHFTKANEEADAYGPSIIEAAHARFKNA